MSARSISGIGHRPRRPVGTVALSLALVAASGCATSQRIAEQTIRQFLGAVQAQDVDRLYCLLAGAAPASGEPADPQRRSEFTAWAFSRYDAYLEGRDRGGVELGDAGIALVKTFALGKGAFHEVEVVRSADGGALTASSKVRFGYAQANYARFSPGTTFYVAGTPVGAIHAIRVPATTGEESAEVLETLTLRWELRLAPAGPDCPERWTVASVEPLPGSATTTRVTWRF